MVAAAVRRRRDIAPHSSQARAQRESRSRSAGRLRSSPREQGAKKASLGPLLDIYRSFCPDRLGANIVSQKGGVFRRAAPPSGLEEMTSEQVDHWLAHALSEWLSPRSQDSSPRAE